MYHESANHHECSYEPRDDTHAIRVTSVQNRICLDYFCRIGVYYCVKTERLRDHLETVGLRTHGRVGALDFQPRLNTAKAIDHVRAIRLDAQDFNDLLSLDIEMVEAVFRGLCRCIRENR